MLSEKELTQVQDAGWILTKHLIMEKAAALLREQVDEINQHFAFLTELGTFNELTATWPKISKGENYRQLPYLILDHPAIFEKNNIFALRTFFWWGNFFSINLHLSGKYKNQFKETLLAKLKNCEDLYYCIHDDEWHHHFEADNFKKVDENIPLSNFTQTHFIKLAFKYDVKCWNNMPQLLHKGYAQMAGLLQNGV